VDGVEVLAVVGVGWLFHPEEEGLVRAANGDGPWRCSPWLTPAFLD